MSKILYLPLDERPCNSVFPPKIFDSEDFRIISLPEKLKGYKKKGADIKEIARFVKESCKGADGAVLSLDMLIYGGLIPSRLHYQTDKCLCKQLSLLEKIKTDNPGMIIYGYSTIMRCPSYSSSDEEHEYYATYGRSIYLYGIYRHKEQLGLLTEDELNELKKLDIPPSYLDDFTKRRKINLQVNLKVIDYLKKGLIDYLVIPQDDSGEYGFTALDQDAIRKKVEAENLGDRILLYPGADEVGSVLLARMFNHFKNGSKKPRIYIKYPTPAAAFMVPSIEDRYLDITVRYQVMASGGLVVESASESDAILFVNGSADRQLSCLTPEPKTRGLTVLRNMVEAFEFLEYAHNIMHKPIMIADVAYGNGSDLECFQKLEAKKMVFDVASYAGWNTSSNTIGSAIAMGMAYLVNGKTKTHLDNLVTRYLEDIAFGGFVRELIWYERLHQYPEYGYYDTKEHEGFISNMVKDEVIRFVSANMASLEGHYAINCLRLPWKRLYEIDLDAEYKE